MAAVNPECPSCETAFGPVPDVDPQDAAPPVGEAPLLGSDVTCDRCGAEFGIYFYP